MIDIDIQISISERSSGWATNYPCMGSDKSNHFDQNNRRKGCGGEVDHPTQCKDMETQYTNTKDTKGQSGRGKLRCKNVFERSSHISYLCQRQLNLVCAW